MENQTLKNIPINDILFELCRRLQVDPLKIERKESKAKLDSYSLNNLTDSEVLVFEFPEHNIERIKYAAQYRRIPYAMRGNKLFVSRSQSAIDAEKLLGRKMFSGLVAGQSTKITVSSLKARSRLQRELQTLPCDLIFISNEAHVYYRKPYEAALNYDAVRHDAYSKGKTGGIVQFDNRRIYWTHSASYIVNDDGCTIGAML